MENNIKNIIENYQYFELNEAQKDLISDWASSSDEFDALKRTFIATDAIGEREINPTIKQRLDVRFAEKYNNNRLVWYNKLWVFLWPNEVPFYKRPLVQFTAVCLITMFTIPFFPNLKKEQLAMNETEQKDDVEENKTEGKRTADKSESEIVEVKEKEEIEAQDALTKSLDEDANQMSEKLAQEQTGWSLSENEEAEKFAESEVFSGSIADQKGQTTERLDDSEPSKPVVAEENLSNDYYATDFDATIEESISSNRKSKDIIEVRKKVEVEETIDLLTALY
ncbi:MAG: hypothetical protein COA32_06715 [Fluviicola sp.]|nr:MAG: hypothetical protein COA32_06715 [Fluviicola sp.]